MNQQTIFSPCADSLIYLGLSTAVCLLQHMTGIHQCLVLGKINKGSIYHVPARQFVILYAIYINANQSLIYMVSILIIVYTVLFVSMFVHLKMLVKPNQDQEHKCQVFLGWLTHLSWVHHIWSIGRGVYPYA